MPSLFTQVILDPMPILRLLDDEPTGKKWIAATFGFGGWLKMPVEVVELGK